ncbi:MAG: helix-turn-helix transcriptional regulator [Firmicutes bacterium]|nr:helix-turn-helix transcriptional regulator [Bacillota bacterium]
MKKKVFNGFQIIHNLIKLRWVPEILKSIHFGNHRYSEIAASIPNMSQTELNRKLSLLMEKGVIIREARDNHTRYILLSFGQDLIHIFEHLEDLEEKYFETSI